MEKITELKFQKLTKKEMKQIEGGRKFWGNETTVTGPDGLDRCSTSTTHYIMWIGGSPSSDSATGDSTDHIHYY